MEAVVNFQFLNLFHLTKAPLDAGLDIRMHGYPQGKISNGDAWFS